MYHACCFGIDSRLAVNPQTEETRQANNTQISVDPDARPEFSSADCIQIVGEQLLVALGVTARAATIYPQAVHVFVLDFVTIGNCRFKLKAQVQPYVEIQSENQDVYSQRTKVKPRFGILGGACRVRPTRDLRNGIIPIAVVDTVKHIRFKRLLFTALRMTVFARGVSLCRQYGRELHTQFRMIRLGRRRIRTGRNMKSIRLFIDYKQIVHIQARKRIAHIAFMYARIIQIGCNLIARQVLFTAFVRIFHHAAFSYMQCLSRAIGGRIENVSAVILLQSVVHVEFDLEGKSERILLHQTEIKILNSDGNNPQEVFELQIDFQPETDVRSRCKRYGNIAERLRLCFDRNVEGTGQTHFDRRPFYRNGRGDRYLIKERSACNGIRVVIAFRKICVRRDLYSA